MKTIARKKPAKKRAAAPPPAYTKVSVVEAKNRLTELLRSGQTTVIHRHGAPAGAIIPFEDEEDYLDWLYNTDPKFREAHAAAVQRAAKDLREGKTIPLEEVKKQFGL